MEAKVLCALVLHITFCFILSEVDSHFTCPLLRVLESPKNVWTARAPLVSSRHGEQ